ncbi:MAG: tetratricopeptide repeat protein [Gemmatimonadetes bacterium]|nr:tetratricopeptide repeat protein [Gemmatimonadota bacterium]
MIHLALALAVSLGDCRGDSTYAVLDFWLGRWTVVDSAGRKQGEDVIERVLDGCAVTEKWTDADGSLGQGLFYYEPEQRRWKQVWVTTRATQLGGLKEKSLIARFPDGGTRFQGELLSPRGVILDRTTLTPMPDGRVHQVIEISVDGGRTWIVNFDAIYVRM